MFKLIIYSCFLFMVTPAQAVETKAETLKKEYSKLFDIVKNITPDYKIGKDYNVKDYGDDELIWRLAISDRDQDFVGIYDKGRRDSFSVRFYRAKHFIPGRNVLRRFIGPVMIGWRSDTIDYNTNEYIRWEGVERPTLEPSELDFLKRWSITPF